MRVRKIKNIDSKIKEVEFIKVYNNEKYVLNELIKYDYKELHLEIGIGKGEFINEISKDKNNFYIGIDKSKEIVYKTSKKIEDSSNVLLIIADAEFINYMFKENIFDRLYLNFSDPWPKNRHYKRRLTYREYLDKYDFILKPDALLEFKTDNDILFDFTLEEFKETNREVFDVSYDITNDSRYINNIVTEYEEKFKSKGQKIKGLRYIVKDKKQ